mmetsp:Transcript_5787/g.13328  ORF Transcript_5787/g.13328 Transcript_5787/m.13328 type:complete len:236 (-) Transcript_5787:898-1605(-)
MEHGVCEERRMFIIFLLVLSLTILTIHVKRAHIHVEEEKERENVVVPGDKALHAQKRRRRVKAVQELEHEARARRAEAQDDEGAEGRLNALHQLRVVEGEVAHFLHQPRHLRQVRKAGEVAEGVLVRLRTARHDRGVVDAALKVRQDHVRDEERVGEQVVAELLGAVGCVEVEVLEEAVHRADRLVISWLEHATVREERAVHGLGERFNQLGAHRDVKQRVHLDAELIDRVLWQL